MIFLASSNLIQKVAINLETARKTVLKWGLSNVFTYNIAKIEVIFFFKACDPKAKEEKATTKLKFGRQEIKFHDKATSGKIYS